MFIFTFNMLVRVLIALYTNHLGALMSNVFSRRQRHLVSLDYSLSWICTFLCVDATKHRCGKTCTLSYPPVSLLGIYSWDYLIRGHSCLLSFSDLWNKNVTTYGLTHPQSLRRFPFVLMSVMFVFLKFLTAHQMVWADLFKTCM